MNPSASGKRKEEVSRYEWIVGALGALIFLFLVTFFVRRAINPTTPVQIETRVDSIVASQAGDFIAYFTAWNRGESSAADVRLSATLHLAADTASADATIARLAAGSSQAGAFLFPHDPNQGQIRVQVVSYQTP